MAQEDKMTELVVMNFKTDGLGFRRYKEVVSQSVTYFVYDLAASDVPGLAPLIAEYDTNGNLVAKYHHDGGLIAMTRGNQSYWHVFEAIGTTRQLVNAQSQVTDSYAYDAWGNELAVQGSTTNPHRYVGKHGYYLDTQSALMLLGVRYYNTANGLFLSRDLVEGYGYSYAADNPVRWIDPRGLLIWDLIGKICKFCESNFGGTIGKFCNILKPFCDAYKEGEKVRKFVCPRPPKYSVCDGLPEGKRVICEGCMTFCKGLPNPCNYCGSLPPMLSDICKKVCNKGCEAICLDIVNRDYGPDWSPCKNVPPSQCIDCCNNICGDNKVCLKPCYNYCALHD